MVRYPLGGMISWAMQYLAGLNDLGHDVYFVEKYGYDNSCYNPLTKESNDEYLYGLQIVSGVMQRFGLENKWCFVSKGDNYHGISKREINEIFATSDVFIDMGSHGSWNEEAMKSGLRVLIDGEPGFTQIKWSNNYDNGNPIPNYNRYFTNGQNIGRPGNPVPTLGLQWEHIFSPVKTSTINFSTPSPNSPYSTVMNWKSHDVIEYKGKKFGQKDLEFEKFINLPTRINVPMEVAVSGNDVPLQKLKENKWEITDAQQITISYDSFNDYLTYCRGEFSVCKNVFVENKTGWFSDKSAAFLATGRPVVLQETGFSSYLPTGEGLFAVRNVEEARLAIEIIESDYSKHSRKAREIAIEFLEAKKIMSKFLTDLGL